MAILLVVVVVVMSGGRRMRTTVSGQSREVEVRPVAGERRGRGKVERVVVVVVEKRTVVVVVVEKKGHEKLVQRNERNEKGNEYVINRSNSVHQGQRADGRVERVECNKRDKREAEEELYVR